MADNEMTVREIDWRSVLSVGHITRAFRIAIWPPSKLLLCLVALAVTLGFGVLLDGWFDTDVNGQSFAENMQGVFRATTSSDQWDPGTLLSFRGFYYGPLDGLREMISLIGAYWQQDVWFAILNTIVAVAVWTFFGGAVCRMAAVQFARDERISMGAALRFACDRYLSLLASPLAMFVVVCLFALPAFFVAGLVLLIPYGGEIVAGIGFFISVILGVVLSLLVLFGVSGLGLQMSVIGAEGRDAFDAVSRSTGYVVKHPWRYILYTLFSLFYMCLTFVLVRLFTFMVLKIPYVFLKATWVGERVDGAPKKLSQIWAEPTLADMFQMPQSDGTLHVAAWLVAITIFILLGAMMAFIPSFLLSSQTIIYFLLRRKVDFKDLDEIAFDEPQGPSGLERLEKTVESVVEPEPPADDDGEAADEESKD